MNAAHGGGGGYQQSSKKGGIDIWEVGYSTETYLLIIIIEHCLYTDLFLIGLIVD